MSHKEIPNCLTENMNKQEETHRDSRTMSPPSGKSKPRESSWRPWGRGPVAEPSSGRPRPQCGFPGTDGGSGPTYVVHASPSPSTDTLHSSLWFPEAKAARKVGRSKQPSQVRTEDRCHAYPAKLCWWREGQGRVCPLPSAWHSLGPAPLSCSLLTTAGPSPAPIFRMKAVSAPGSARPVGCARC